MDFRRGYPIKAFLLDNSESKNWFISWSMPIFNFIVHILQDLLGKQTTGDKYLFKRANLLDIKQYVFPK